jgi:hypothetical protein
MALSPVVAPQVVEVRLRHDLSRLGDMLLSMAKMMFERRIAANMPTCRALLLDKMRKRIRTILRYIVGFVEPTDYGVYS